MAKKEKEPEAEAEGEKPEGEGATPRPRKVLARFSARSKARKVLMIAVPALLVGAGRRRRGRVFLPLSEERNHEAKAEEVPLTPPNVAFSDMQDILVNIQSNDGTPPISSWASRWSWKTRPRKAALEPLMPRITDQFQAYLRELRLDDSKARPGAAPEGRAAAPGQCGGRAL
jgi:flagellar FliL protein